MKKTNFIITIKYEIPMFLLVEPFFDEGGRGSRKFWQQPEIFWIFSIEVAQGLVKGEKFREKSSSVPL